MADQNIYVIIDGSGSMRDVKNDVVTGINEYIKEQQDDVKVTGDDVLFSLTTFDSQVLEIYENEDLLLVTPLAVAQTFLGGGTALLDAIGKTLTNAEDNAAPRNLVVIYTDGEENSSREFKTDDIAKLIEKLEASGKWQFVYLGAEFGDFRDDKAFRTVSASSGSSMSSVNTSKASVGQTFKNLSDTSTLYRSATDKDISHVADAGGLVAYASASGIDWEAVDEDKTKPTNVKESKK